MRLHEHTEVNMILYAILVMVVGLTAIAKDDLSN
jgi:hypothetical protein